MHFETAKCDVLKNINFRDHPLAELYMQLFMDNISPKFLGEIIMLSYPWLKWDGNYNNIKLSL